MNNEEEKDFKYVNEQIVEPSKFKKILKRIGFICMCVFIPAGVSIGVLWSSGKIPRSKETTKETTYFTFPRDTTKESENSETSSVKDSKEELSQKELKKTAKEVSKSFVTILTYKSNQVKIGDKPENISSGVIIKYGTNLSILTEYGIVQDAKKIEVIFRNKTIHEATVKSSDSITGLAVITVADYLLDKETRQLVEEVTLGNSMAVEKGDQVIYLGNPIDDNVYEDYGIITSKSEAEIVDGQINLMYTNINSAGNANGYLLDTNGFVIGIVNNMNNTDKKILSVIGVSAVKGVIERLTNNVEMPYLGIRGETITSKVVEKYDEDMPFGVFVTEVIEESPAYKSIIRTGDIIVKINNKPIRSLYHMNEVMGASNVGTHLLIEVKRDELNGYNSYIIDVILEERK